MNTTPPPPDPAGETTPREKLLALYRRAFEAEMTIEETADATLALLLPAPATGATGDDGKRLDWLEKNPFTLYRTRDPGDGKMPDYCVLVDEDCHKDGQYRTGILKPTARACIDSAIAARDRGGRGME